jgi:hypothetical protein
MYFEEPISVPSLKQGKGDFDNNFLVGLRVSLPDVRERTRVSQTSLESRY